ncbi:MAG TPA: hypothetical protein VM694_44410 [Polyangium sp.]|nr:hypothetical protein [Polyangium sp.]
MLRGAPPGFADGFGLGPGADALGAEALDTDALGAGVLGASSTRLETGATTGGSFGAFVAALAGAAVTPGSFSMAGVDAPANGCTGRFRKTNPSAPAPTRPTTAATITAQRRPEPGRADAWAAASPTYVVADAAPPRELGSFAACRELVSSA